MKKYCTVSNDGIITNIILSDDKFASDIGARIWYENANIGDAYIQPLSIEERLNRIEKQLGIK